MSFAKPFVSQALALALLLPAAAAAKKPAEHTLTSGGEERSYFLFVPEEIDPAQPVPLLVVFHGSGRNGASLVDPWIRLASREGFIVAGPNSGNPEVWAAPGDGPRFLHDLVEHLKAAHPIDPRRVYLFGHSAGAGFALQMSLLESTYFAAAAVHAGALQQADHWMIRETRRKIPIHIAIGTKDQVISPALARRTWEALEAQGFPGELVEMRFHDHWYYDSAAKINKAAWEFLKQHRLAEEPRYLYHAFQ